MAAEASRSKRWVRRIVLLGALGAAVAGGAAAVTHATGVWGRPSDGVQEQVKRAIVGYELAKASERPPGMVGRKLTKADKAALQARFQRRLARYATGPALAWGETWDYAAALDADEWSNHQFVGVTGKLVYWDSPRKDIGGEVHVKACVLQRYSLVRWSEKTGRTVPQADWLPSESVDDYTLEQIDGVWKVADSTHWRFYDPVSGQLGTGP